MTDLNEENRRLHVLETPPFSSNCHAYAVHCVPTTPRRLIDKRSSIAYQFPHDWQMVTRTGLITGLYGVDSTLRLACCECCFGFKDTPCRPSQPIHSSLIVLDPATSSTLVHRLFGGPLLLLLTSGMAINKCRGRQRW